MLAALHKCLFSMAVDATPISWPVRRSPALYNRLTINRPLVPKHDMPGILKHHTAVRLHRLGMHHPLPPNLVKCQGISAHSRSWHHELRTAGTLDQSRHDTKPMLCEHCSPHLFIYLQLKPLKQVYAASRVELTTQVGIHIPLPPKLLDQVNNVGLFLVPRQTMAVQHYHAIWQVVVLVNDEGEVCLWEQKHREEQLGAAC